VDGKEPQVQLFSPFFSLIIPWELIRSLGPPAPSGHVPSLSIGLMDSHYIECALPCPGPDLGVGVGPPGSLAGGARGPGGARPRQVNLNSMYGMVHLHVFLSQGQCLANI
jgi:hypothetical protein